MPFGGGIHVAEGYSTAEDGKAWQTKLIDLVSLALRDEEAPRSPLVVYTRRYRAAYRKG